MREYKYGIISDIHAADPRLVYTALDTFKKRKVDAVILNGDILGNRYRGPDLKPEDYLPFILHVADELGLETYIQPGSHESFAHFHGLVKALMDKHENTHYTLENPAIEEESHKLIFLPGSDWTVRGVFGYKISDENPTGIIKYLDKTGSFHLEYNINPHDIKSLVEDPQNTILVSHVPRRFSTENAVDIAHFVEIDVINADGLVRTTGVTPVKAHKPQPGVPFIEYNPNLTEEELKREIVEVAREYAKKNNTDLVTVEVERKTNRGNETLAEILEKEGITKGISGHFHESVWNAHDTAGEYIPPKKPTSELFWNASLMDEGKFGILHVLDGEVYYTNLEIKG